MTMAADREAATSQDDRLDLRTWLRLLTCTTLVERTVRARLRDKFDTTLPRFEVLAQLDRAPDGLAMGELSARLMVTNGNVTGLVDRLVTDGLVERHAAADDRRRAVVRLSPAGRRAFDRMAPAHAAWIADMFAGLDREASASLYGLLADLKQSASRGMA